MSIKEKKFFLRVSRSKKKKKLAVKSVNRDDTIDTPSVFVCFYGRIIHNYANWEGEEGRGKKQIYI